MKTRFTTKKMFLKICFKRETFLLQYCNEFQMTFRILTASDEGFDSSDLLYILVHPLYFKVPRDSEYVEKIDDLIEKAPEPIITLEEERSIDDTVMHYRILLPTIGSRYFIRTKNSDPFPSEMNWQDFTNILLRFNPKRIIIGGALLQPQENSPEMKGCVGDLYERLKEDFSKNGPEVYLDTEYCYSI